MDTSEAAFTYIGAKSKRVRPDITRLLQEMIATNHETSGQALTAVAPKVGYSTVQIRRLCLQEFGEPVGSFWTECGVERAAGRLATETTSVKNIAQEARYAASQAFGKAFRAYFGCSPSVFRSLNISECGFPGYQISLALPKWERNVKVQIAAEVAITFIYDGPVFLGRMFSDGRIDWTLP